MVVRSVERNEPIEVGLDPNFRKNSAQEPELFKGSLQDAAAEPANIKDLGESKIFRAIGDIQCKPNFFPKSR